MRPRGTGSGRTRRPDDERFIEQATRFQVVDQGRNRPIHRRALIREAADDILVGRSCRGNPSPSRRAGRSAPLLDQATRQQAVVGKARGPRLRAVGVEHPLGLTTNVHHFRHRGLHPKRELILSDPGERLGVPQLLRLHLVEVPEQRRDSAAGASDPSPRGPRHTALDPFRTALHPLKDRGRNPLPNELLPPLG